MVYIRSMEDALSELADILDLPLRRDQLIRSTVGIMSCLDVEPRQFMADCQALLIEGGLERLREKRRQTVETLEPATALVVLDPEEDRFFEAVASGLDALRLADVVHKVFPDLRASRWLGARALMAQEAALQARITDAIRAGRETEEFAQARQAVEGLLDAHRPAWHDRVGTLRVACSQFLKEAGVSDPDRLHEESELLFELFAVSDDRAAELLAAIDRNPREAAARVGRLRETLEAIRAVEAEGGKSAAGGEGEKKGVA